MAGFRIVRERDAAYGNHRVDLSFLTLRTERFVAGYHPMELLNQ